MLHPLFAPVPALLDYTHDNRHLATWQAALFPLVSTWVVSGMLILLLSALSRKPRPVAFAVSLAVVAFYAHHATGAWAWWMWAGVAVVGIGAFAHRGAGDVLTTFANLLLGFAILPGVWTTIQDTREDPPPHVRPGYLDALAIPAQVDGPLPDIWYIVLDGYGREDVLRDLYGIERGLAGDLRARGFYVAAEAHSNYAQTALSFATTLNMEPLGDLLVDVAPASRNRLPLATLIGENRVVRALRAAGYRIVQYPGEYSMTRLADADETRGPWLQLDEYTYELAAETALLPLTEALGWEQNRLCQEIRRRGIDAVFDELPAGDRDPGPTFAYVHIVAPHPPFVFAPDGSYRPSRSAGFFGDGSSWQVTARRYKERYDDGYRDQVAYVDRRVLEAVDGIRAHAERPPIILIQGDHGPGLKLDWSNVAATDKRERMGILSAYLLPDTSALYPSITPMNSFRVVLDQVLGAELPLIEDRVWFSTFSRPYVGRDVTNEVREAGTSP